MSDSGPKESTPDAELRRQIMSYSVPKNEREWWALHEIERQGEAKDEAYLERNLMVAYLATCFPSGIARTDIPGWLPEWHGCVYIDLPSGQVSWHYHDSEAPLFANLPPYRGQWDGHTTDEKYRRLTALSKKSES